MLYIGHFSFDEIGAAREIRHGYFTSVVEAANRDSSFRRNFHPRPDSLCEWKEQFQAL